MLYATKLRMCPGCNDSTSCQDISDIYLEGDGANQYYSKAVLHDHLCNNPSSICVGISPYPELLPAVSVRMEKYVRSEANDTPYDNLLRLPKV